MDFPKLEKKWDLCVYWEFDGFERPFKERISKLVIKVWGRFRWKIITLISVNFNNIIIEYQHTTNKKITGIYHIVEHDEFGQWWPCTWGACKK